MLDKLKSVEEKFEDINAQLCGHEVMVPRVKAEKNIRKILRGDEEIKK